MPLDPDGINCITCDKCAGTRGFVESCDRCSHTGYVYSFVTNFGDIVSVCYDCKGTGCDKCNYTGTIVKHHKYPEYSPSSIADLIPMPYGKMLPDLTDCNYVNEPEWSSYSGPILCPSCGSDNVAGLSSKHNPECSVMEENLTPSGRWFCISCQDSWCYERER